MCELTDELISIQERVSSDVFQTWGRRSFGSRVATFVGERRGQITGWLNFSFLTCSALTGNRKPALDDVFPKAFPPPSLISVYKIPLIRDGKIKQTKSIADWNWIVGFFFRGEITWVVSWWRTFRHIAVTLKTTLRADRHFRLVQTLGRCLTRKYAHETFPKTWKAANQWTHYSSNDSDQFLHSPLYLFASALWIQSGPIEMSSENDVPHVPYSPDSLHQEVIC